MHNMYLMFTIYSLILHASTVLSHLILKTHNNTAVKWYLNHFTAVLSGFYVTLEVSLMMTQKGRNM
jgi:hypothetical protein